MGIETELSQFTTTDGERLHGALFSPRDDASDFALLLLHGVGNNFYSGTLTEIGQGLAERGFHNLVMNTRGHDWVANGKDEDSHQGASYENFEDCVLDVDGAM